MILTFGFYKLNTLRLFASMFCLCAKSWTWFVLQIWICNFFSFFFHITIFFPSSFSFSLSFKITALCFQFHVGELFLFLPTDFWYIFFYHLFIFFSSSQAIKMDWCLCRFQKREGDGKWKKKTHIERYAHKYECTFWTTAITSTNSHQSERKTTAKRNEYATNIYSFRMSDGMHFKRLNWLSSASPSPPPLSSFSSSHFFLSFQFHFIPPFPCPLLFAFNIVSL